MDSACSSLCDKRRFTNASVISLFCNLNMSVMVSLMGSICAPLVALYHIVNSHSFPVMHFIPEAEAAGLRPNRLEVDLLVLQGLVEVMD